MGSFEDEKDPKESEEQGQQDVAITTTIVETEEEAVRVLRPELISFYAGLKRFMAEGYEGVYPIYTGDLQDVELASETGEREKVPHLVILCENGVYLVRYEEVGRGFKKLIEGYRIDTVPRLPRLNREDDHTVGSVLVAETSFPFKTSGPALRKVGERIYRREGDLSHLRAAWVGELKLPSRSPRIKAASLSGSPVRPIGAPQR